MNANRWSGRHPSLRAHRKSWSPPDLPEQGSASDKIMNYSRQDYVIGDSSPAMLQSIAHRLNHGPNTAQILPELDTSELESQMAELSRQRSAAAELDANFVGFAELDSQQVNSSQGETASSGLSQEEPRGYLSVAYREPQDLQANTEHASPSASRQVETSDRKWEGGFF